MMKKKRSGAGKTLSKLNNKVGSKNDSSHLILALVVLLLILTFLNVGLYLQSAFLQEKQQTGDVPALAKATPPQLKGEVSIRIVPPASKTSQGEING